MIQLQKGVQGRPANNSAEIINGAPSGVSSGASITNYLLKLYGQAKEEVHCIIKYSQH